MLIVYDINSSDDLTTFYGGAQGLVFSAQPRYILEINWLNNTGMWKIKKGKINTLPLHNSAHKSIRQK